MLLFAYFCRMLFLNCLCLGLVDVVLLGLARGDQVAILELHGLVECLYMWVKQMGAMDMYFCISVAFHNVYFQICQTV